MEKDKKEPAQQEELAKTKVISEMETRKGEKLVIGVREYKGKSYFESRLWFQPNENQPSWYPTKKGFILPMDKLSGYIGSLCDLAETEGVDVQGK